MCFLRVFHLWTGRTRLPLVAWFALSLFCFYGVAQTHDYFAQLRARLVVTDDLEHRGIPRTSIMAGFEYDGWTQITVAGHYNDPRIRKPEGIYIPAPKSPGFATIYPCWIHTPAVHPDYVVALAQHPELRMTDLPPRVSVLVASAPPTIDRPGAGPCVGCREPASVTSFPGHRPMITSRIPWAEVLVV